MNLTTEQKIDLILEKMKVIDRQLIAIRAIIESSDKHTIQDYSLFVNERVSDKDNLCLELCRLIGHHDETCD